MAMLNNQRVTKKKWGIWLIGWMESFVELNLNSANRDDIRRTTRMLGVPMLALWAMLGFFQRPMLGLFCHEKLQDHDLHRLERS